MLCPLHAHSASEQHDALYDAVDGGAENTTTYQNPETSIAQKNERSFEDVLKRLEDIVHMLEAGRPLAESMELYKEGKILEEQGQKHLEEAKKLLTSSDAVTSVSAGLNTQ